MARTAWALAGALACATAAGEAALAGAWTQPPGGVFVSVGGGYYATDSGGYEEFSAATYGEIGFREGLTLGGALETSTPVGVSSDQDGDITVSAFVRTRLHEGPFGDPFSLQIGAALPLGDFVDTGQAQLDREREIDARLLYGRGFGTDYGDAFIDAQGGLRFRLEDSADQIRVDLTAGLRPAPRWLALTQVFTTVSLRNEDADGDDFDVVKLAPSVGYEIAPGLTLVLGLEREVYGRNIDRGLRGRLSLWRSF